jgi:hypothetical protein
MFQLAAKACLCDGDKRHGDNLGECQSYARQTAQKTARAWRLRRLRGPRSHQHRPPHTASLKTIQTEAIISARDETGTTFARVVQKLKQMEDRADGGSKKLSATTKAAQTAQAAGPKAERASSGLMAGRIPSVVTAIIAAESIRALAEAIGARVHEAVRMETAGMTPAEIEQAKASTAKLARQYPSIPQTELMHMYRTARAITGGTEEGAAALEMMAPLRVTMGNRPDAEENMDLLLKAMEIKRVTQKPEEFKSYIDAIGRATQLFSESTLKPVQYFEMMKYGRQATAGLSEKFITRVGPTLAQEMGGMSFGQSVASFNRAIVGGHMDHGALKRLASLGLINKDDLDYLKTGEIKGLKVGRHVQGYELAQSNPYEWVRQILLPAMEKKGITKKEDVLAETAQLFSKQTAAQLVGIFATQSQRIDKDMALLEKAQGAVEAARTLQQKDPGTQLTAAKNVVGDLAGTVGADLFTNTGALNAVTGALGTLNERLTNIVPGSGQEKFNRGMGALFVPAWEGLRRLSRQKTKRTRRDGLTPLHRGCIQATNWRRSAPWGTRSKGSLRRRRSSRRPGRR